MGVAILWIMLFHFGSIGILSYDALIKFGWIGVDIFFFLSAFGLCFSLEKKPGLLPFYKRRLKRILPTWLLILFIVHIIGLICIHYSIGLFFDMIPQDIRQYFTWYTGLGYWIINFVPVRAPHEWYYEWYIPTLLFFYLITPWLYKQSSKMLIAIVLLVMIINPYIIDIIYNKNLDSFLFRIPIFLFGILYYRMKVRNFQFQRNVIIYSFLLGVSFSIGNYYEITSVELCYIVLLVLPFSCIIVTHLLDWMCLNGIMAFLGSISLELYLIHLYKRPCYFVGLFIDNNIIVLIISMILCVIIAYLLHIVVSYSILKKLVRMFAFNKQRIK